MIDYIATTQEKLLSLLHKGAFHIILGTFLTKFVSFFGSVFLVRMLSKSDYGVLCYYENFYSYFMIFYGLGMASGILRYMVIANDINEKCSCLKYVIKRGTIWNIILSVCCCVFLCLYPHPVAFEGQYVIIFALSCCIVFAFLNEVSFAALRGLFDNRHYAILSFCTATILIFFRVIGASMDGMYGSVLGRLLAEALCGVMCLLFVKRTFFSVAQPQLLTDDFKHGLNVFSLQIMITNGLWTIFMLNDMFLLGQLCGSDTIIADYKIAYFIPANLAILVSSIGIFISPYFTKYDNECNYIWVRKHFAMVLKITMLIMGASVILCYVFAKPIIVILFGRKYLSAVPIMRVLLVAAFCTNGIRYPIANILSSMGQQKINLVVAMVGMLCQIIIDICLIPKYGALGVAFTSVFVYVFMSACLFMVFWRKYYKI